MANAIRSIRDRIRRFAADDAPAVHFHQGPHGNPAPCFDERCSSPHLTV